MDGVDEDSGDKLCGGDDVGDIDGDIDGDADTDKTEDGERDIDNERENVTAALVDAAAGTDGEPDIDSETLWEYTPAIASQESNTC